MFGGSASGRPVGIFQQFDRKTPGGLHISWCCWLRCGVIRANVFPLNQLAMLGVLPALAARILGWALYQALKSTSCSCYTPNSPLPAGRCGRARTNYGRQMKTRSGIAVASLKQGRVNAVRAAFNAGFISAADRRNHAHNEGRRPS
jgi:hypothetical protein